MGQMQVKSKEISFYTDKQKVPSQGTPVPSCSEMQDKTGTVGGERACQGEASFKSDLIQISLTLFA